jgi:hypothetical protein
LPKEHDNQLFVKAMVSAPRGLNKITIAEAVEDEVTFECVALCRFRTGIPSERLRTTADVERHHMHCTMDGCRSSSR